MSDELRRQGGPAEPDRGTAPVAVPYLARSDPTGEGTHLQMTCLDATLGRFETQHIHRDRGTGSARKSSSAPADRDAIAAQLLRYGDGHGDDWADIIDMLTMHPEERRRVVRLLGELEAKEGT
jgi:hypothetical protein